MGSTPFVLYRGSRHMMSKTSLLVLSAVLLFSGTLSASEGAGESKESTMSDAEKKQNPTREVEIPRHAYRHLRDSPGCLWRLSRR